MKPTIGRIVHYRLTQADAAAINRRRTTGASIASRLADEKWPAGAQAHIGNPAYAGQVFPAIVVEVWPNEHGPEHDGINAQVFLDGNDTLWVTSVGEGEGPGQWQWPPRG